MPYMMWEKKYHFFVYNYLLSLSYYFLNQTAGQPEIFSDRLNSLTRPRRCCPTVSLRIIGFFNQNDF